MKKKEQYIQRCIRTEKWKLIELQESDYLERFFEKEITKHLYIRSRTLAMDYMDKVLNIPNDCRCSDSEKVRKLRHSIIIKFTKIMRRAVRDKKVKKYNSHMYKVIVK